MPLSYSAGIFVSICDWIYSLLCGIVCREKGWCAMANDNIFQTIYSDLEEPSSNNVAHNLELDSNFKVASKKESKLYKQYEELNLSKKQRKIIE